MKVLLYNFIFPDRTHANAGGVGVYLDNLSKALLERGEEVILLSSGDEFSPWSSKPEVVFSRKDGFHRAKIINSPVIAPAYENFFSLETYLQNTELDGIPAALKKRFGLMDVLHFQNLEGLTLGFFRETRKVFPGAKIILSAHNYNLVCPQVNLWKDDRQSCTDYEEGRACVTCIPYRTADLRKRVRATWWLKAKTRFLPAFVTNGMLRRRNLPIEDLHRSVELHPGMTILKTADMSSVFRAFRTANIELAQTTFDHVLAVSERTRTILLAHGIASGNLTTSYIGSRHVTRDQTKRRVRWQDTLHIAYLGYARRDKGFDFLMEALETLPEDLAKRLVLTIAARVHDNSVIGRAGRLGRRLVSVNLINGYDSRLIGPILRPVDLGVVPPLWEDNLPQVAIEFVANGVPILSSDAGGASEIARNPDFTFTRSSTAEFHVALRRIIEGKVSLADFWTREPNIRSFDSHLDDLVSLYKPVDLPPAPITNEAELLS